MLLRAAEPLDPPFPPAKVQKKKVHLASHRALVVSIIVPTRGELSVDGLLCALQAWEALAAGLATDANGVVCADRLRIAARA